jgi:hypothetical protein
MLAPHWRRFRQLAEREYEQIDEELRAKVRYRVNMLCQEDHLPAALARLAIDEASTGGHRAKQVLWRSARSAAVRLGATIGSSDPAAEIVRDLLERTRSAPAATCLECGTSGGRHAKGCSQVGEPAQASPANSSAGERGRVG